MQPEPDQCDTAEIARSFWTNEEMGGSLRLDGVVCVVDSRNVLKVSPGVSLEGSTGDRRADSRDGAVCVCSNWKKGKNVKSEPLPRCCTTFAEESVADRLVSVIDRSQHRT